MINEGFKSKPLDRYPYMENDLKKYGVNTFKVICDNIDNLSEYIDYINTNYIDKITELRFYDCGTFYYALIKIQFKNDLSAGDTIRLLSFKREYRSSQPTTGFLNSIYTVGAIRWGKPYFDVRKIFESDDFVALSNIDEGLIFTGLWPK